MNLRTYRAYSLQQALDAVREDLGPGAVILRTRQVKRGGVLGIGRRTIVEVTASDVPPRAPVRLPADERVEAATPAASPSAKRRSLPRRGRPVELEASDGPTTGPTTGPAPDSPAPAGGWTPAPRPVPTVDPSPSPAPNPPAGIPADDDHPLNLDRERTRTRALARRMLAAHEAEQEARATVSREPVDDPGATRVPDPPPYTGRNGPRRDGAGPESPPARPTPASPAAPAPSFTVDASTESNTVPTAAPAIDPPRAAPSAAASDAPDAAPALGDQAAPLAARMAPATDDAIVARSEAQSEAQSETQFVAESEAAANTPAVAPPAMPVADLRTPPPAVPPATDATLQDELDAIRDLVGDVIRAGAADGTRELPQLLFDHHLALMAQDMTPDLADHVIEQVRRELDPGDLGDAARVRAAVHARIASLVPIAEAPADRPRRSGPRIIALVGPTGVGKTTTVAKLAASFALRGGQRVGLITADTYRIAAVDQLRTYAEIIRVPLEVAVDAEGVREAVKKLRDRDVVIVDTAGRSQHDADRIDDLRAIVAAADPSEVHLVLSATAGARVLRREADAFARVGVDRIMLTKLDEAVSFGMLVDVIHRIGRRLSYVTTGQEVPDHIERGDAGRLAELVLGGRVRR